MTCNYEILRISEINGKRKEIDYNYRKTKFETLEKLEEYKKYLQHKLGEKLFFDVKDWTKKTELVEV